MNLNTADQTYKKGVKSSELQKNSQKGIRLTASFLVLFFFKLYRNFIIIRYYYFLKIMINFIRRPFKEIKVSRFSFYHGIASKDPNHPMVNNILQRLCLFFLVYFPWNMHKRWLEDSWILKVVGSINIFINNDWLNII